MTAEVHAHSEQDEDERPAWSLAREAVPGIALENPLPDRVDREWALGGATGKGIKVCVLDSGVELGHPAVGSVAGATAISIDADGNTVAEPDTEGDLCGHGTACAGVIRSIAPDAEIYSVRVLGAGFTGSGKVLLAGLRWAVEQDYDVINMSLSTTKKAFSELLRDIADIAYFKRTLLVASAHNMPVESFPWRFSSVISVGSHEEDDPLTFYANPDPPVEFFARGVNVEVAWLGGSTITATGNSFATPAISAIAALVLSKHERLTPFQLKSVLYLISSNVGGKQ
ncbi:MAG TPA: S8 family serine peptidase [Gaiellaceae bacterium]|nr:S8 family serine peptidase [Gaiellaceae bacterium]